MNHLEVLKEMLKKKYCNHGVCEKHSYPECGLTRGLLCPYDEKPKEVQALTFFIEAYEQAGAELPEEKKHIDEVPPMDSTLRACGYIEGYNACHSQVIPVVMRLKEELESRLKAVDFWGEKCEKLKKENEKLRKRYEMGQDSFNEQYETKWEYLKECERLQVRLKRAEEMLHCWEEYFGISVPLALDKVRATEFKLAEIKAEAIKYKDKLASLEKRAGVDSIIKNILPEKIQKINPDVVYLIAERISKSILEG